MKLSISTILLALTTSGLAAGANVYAPTRRAADRLCSEADRFGDVTVTPSLVNAGDTMTVAVDLTCGIQNFGIVPEFIEYSLQVLPPNNNGSPAEEPIVLGINAFNGAGGPFDALVTTIPFSIVRGAAYALIITNIHPVNVSGQSLLRADSIQGLVTINSLSVPGPSS